MKTGDIMCPLPSNGIEERYNPKPKASLTGRLWMDPGERSFI